MTHTRSYRLKINDSVFITNQLAQINFHRLNGYFFWWMYIFWYSGIILICFTSYLHNLPQVTLELNFFPYLNLNVFSLFIFQLQLTFNTILYWFQVYSIVVRQSYTLQSGPPHISSIHLALYLVITILLTIFPMGMYFTSPRLLHSYDQFVVLNPFTFFTQSPNPLPSGNHQSIFFIYESVSIYFALYFLKINIHHFLKDFTYF